MLISMIYFVFRTCIVVIGKKQKQAQIYKDIIKKFVAVLLNSQQSLRWGNWLPQKSCNGFSSKDYCYI